MHGVGWSTQSWFYEQLKSECLQLLEGNGPLDGLVVLNHGAAEVKDLGRHGDTDFITAIREQVGPQTGVAVPFDHHGQVTPELLSAVDVLSALPTAPHRDAYETSRRAAQQLIDVLRSGRRPFKAAVRTPIYVPGEKSMTIFSPAKELFELLPSYDVVPGVCGANIFVGFGWNDVPWCGIEIVVTHFGSEAEAVRLATELADQIWERRKDLRLQMETATVQEGMRRASALPGKLIYLSDSGDNTTAGAGGDLTFVLQEALEQGVEDIVVAGIFDRRFVEVAHQAGPGNTVSVEIGHHLSAEPKVRKVSATLISVGDRLDVSAYPNLTSSPAPWEVVSVQGVIATTFHAARVGITGPAYGGNGYFA